MNKVLIKRITAFILVLFIVSLILLSMYFAIMGNALAMLSLLSFSGFFSVIMYFLLRFNRAVKNDLEKTLEETQDEKED